ncbi:copper homeostasis protein CutC [Vibrio sp. qd031]|uniref:copper homeostasis protein CutC n=1 Tax=Vibrio sp. qd031 TaxID=1603038 RepID=UPI000A10232D|nr:copper homeostasis protein CutC [Vibrio sp. qd031]ORT49162.1 copper homeostasis protein CutC [Vibrio sp. qd031]
MPVFTEVCVDHIESLLIAAKAGAGRIELCSSLEVGGLTPSAGLMSLARRHCNIPVYAMIRARQGDFLFSDHDKEQMLFDIHQAKQANLDGIVIGSLHADGNIDQEFCREAVALAGPLGVTFHRAIDHCNDPIGGLDPLISLGVERVLTSGGKASAERGIETLSSMVKQANGRLSIMAGAGINQANVANIVAKTGVREVHLSGKTLRDSNMQYRNVDATMGSLDVDDFSIPVTDFDKIQAVTQLFK